MARVIEIVKAHLVANGFDGLVHVDAECGCLLEDLQPCGEDCGGCEPAYRGAHEEGDFGDWAMYRTKARALESVETVRARGKTHNAGGEAHAPEQD